MANTPKKIFPPPSSLKQSRVLVTSTAKSVGQKKSTVNNKITKAYGLHKKNLTKRAIYKTSDVDLSEDLVQSTFLKTLLYLQRGGRVDIMRAFLNHILNNLIIDEYRKRKNLSLDILLEKGFELSIDDTEKLTDIFDGKQIIRLIDDLPEKYQTIIRMRYIQDLSLKEISILTNQTQNTVAVQAYRGLKRLKTLEANSHK